MQLVSLSKGDTKLGSQASNKAGRSRNLGKIFCSFQLLCCPKHIHSADCMKTMEWQHPISIQGIALDSTFLNTFLTKHNLHALPGTQFAKCHFFVTPVCCLRLVLAPSPLSVPTTSELELALQACTSTTPLGCFPINLMKSAVIWHTFQGNVTPETCAAILGNASQCSSTTWHSNKAGPAQATSSGNAPIAMLLSKHQKHPAQPDHVHRGKLSSPAF